MTFLHTWLTQNHYYFINLEIMLHKCANDISYLWLCTNYIGKTMKVITMALGILFLQKLQDVIRY